MLYICGTNLESSASMATHNLKQILGSNFSASGNVNFVVMTGGANKWHLDKDYLVFPEGVSVPYDAVVDDMGVELDSKSQISNCYNQIWEAKGADAAENPGKLVLLDGDGITSNEPIESEQELVVKPETLKAFINYGVAKYPADKYDLILWDHGGGPAGGFGGDDHNMLSGSMPFSGIVDAIRDNAVTNRADADESNDGKFDFIDFDACLMSSIELSLVLADYTDYYIASPEIEPGYGQCYTGWLEMVGEDPNADTYELGKKAVDDTMRFYEEGEGKGEDATLAVFNRRRT